MIKIFILLVFITSSLAKNKNTERHYQKIVAKELKGIIEHTLPDRTRVDIFTEDVAYEVDFAYKWAEGIGQALHYSTITGRDAGLVLIIETEAHEKFVKRVLHIMKQKSLRLILYVYDNRDGKLSRVSE